MEKEIGLPKPADLLIGVIDFFAVLVPGVIATALLVYAVAPALPNANALYMGGLLTVGWVLGHVLHGLGSFLDPLLYDPFFKPAARPDTIEGDTQKQNLLLAAAQRLHHKIDYLHKGDDLYRLARASTDLPGGKRGDETGSEIPGGMYQWARAWLGFRNPKATADLDRLEADSKLFRSLAVLLLALVPFVITGPLPDSVGALSEHRATLAIIVFAGAVFSLWRYCDLRSKMVRQCYLNYVQLRFESGRDREKAVGAA